MQSLPQRAVVSTAPLVPLACVPPLPPLWAVDHRWEGIAAPNWCAPVPAPHTGRWCPLLDHASSSPSTSGAQERRACHKRFQHPQIFQAAVRTAVRAAAAAVPPACLPAAAASAAAGSGPLRDRAMLHPSACAASGGFAPHGTLSPHLLALLPEYPAAASALLCAPFSGPQVWTLLLESSITAELRHVAFTICQQ